jgi:hypothetical protein
MILRSFASNQPYVLVSLPVAVGAVLLPSIWMQPLQVLDLNLPLSAELGGLFTKPWLSSIVAMAIVLLGSWLSNAVFNRSEFYNTPTYVVALLFAFFGSVFAIYQLNFSVLLASLLVLLGLERQLCIFKQSRVLSLCFETGFWYGLATLLFPPFATLIAGSWIALLFNRAFNLREHLLLLIAFSIPFLYWFVYLFWFGRTQDFVLFKIIASFNPPTLAFQWTWALFYLVLIAGFGLVIGLPRYLKPSDRAGNKTKMVKNTFLIMAAAQVCSMLIGFSLYHVWILPAAMVVAVVMLGYWFTNYRYSLLAPLVFYALLILGALTVSGYYLTAQS